MTIFIKLLFMLLLIPLYVFSQETTQKTDFSPTQPSHEENAVVNNLPSSKEDSNKLPETTNLASGNSSQKADKTTQTVDSKNSEAVAKSSLTSNLIHDQKAKNLSFLQNPPQRFYHQIDPSASIPVENQYGAFRSSIKKYYPITAKLGFQLSRQWKHPKLIWFFIHNDEFDAYQVHHWAVLNLGGYGLSLKNNSNPKHRNIRFLVKHVGEMEMDPNRIFTQKGMIRNLKLINKKAMKSYRLRRKIIPYAWNHISKPSIRTLLIYWKKKIPLIALHNNRLLNIIPFENNTLYEVAVFEENPISSFIVTINKNYFNILKKHRINVVYQKKICHDGSLSDFALIKKFPYLNLETHIGDQELQKRMVYAVVYLLFPQQLKN